jgi:hypothetical protein
MSIASNKAGAPITGMCTVSPHYGKSKHHSNIAAKTSSTILRRIGAAAIRLILSFRRKTTLGA